MSNPIYLAIASLKGGVGKTSLTVLAASILHYHRGCDVAVVDCNHPVYTIARLRQQESEELQQVGSVLSCKNAPIEEAAKAAETIYKIHDSPMFQAIKKAAGERVRELLERVAEEAPKEVQSGNFDYKRFIKT